jgi:predicted membrane protein
MDIPVVAVALITGLLLSPRRALAITAVAWVAALVMVGWGPAHNSNVHLRSVGFWGPWLILLALCTGLVFGIDAIQRRRAAKRVAAA